MNLVCQINGCKVLTEDSIVCEFHRRNLSKSQERKMLRLWRDLVISNSRTAYGYKCFHCDRILTEEEAIADHWPYTKGANSKTKFDLRNGVCCCQSCNTSGSKKRKIPKQSDFDIFN